MKTTIEVQKSYDVLGFVFKAIGASSVPRINRGSIPQPETPNASFEVTMDDQLYTIVIGTGGADFCSMIPDDVGSELMSSTPVLDGADEFGSYCFYLGRSLAALALIAVTDYPAHNINIPGLAKLMFLTEQLSKYISNQENRLFELTGIARTTVSPDIERIHLIAKRLADMNKIPHDFDSSEIMEMAFYSMYMIGVSYILRSGASYSSGVTGLLSDLSKSEVGAGKALTYLLEASKDDVLGRILMTLGSYKHLTNYIRTFVGYDVSDPYSMAIGQIVDGFSKITSAKILDVGNSDAVTVLREVMAEEAISFREYITSSPSVFGDDPIRALRFAHRFDIPEDSPPQNTFDALFDLDRDWLGTKPDAKKDLAIALVGFFKDLTATGVGNIVDTQAILHIAIIAAATWRIKMDKSFADESDDVKTMITQAYYLAEGYLYALYTRWFVTGNVYRVKYASRSIDPSGAINVYTNAKLDIDFVLTMYVQYVERWAKFPAAGSQTNLEFIARQKSDIALFAEAIEDGMQFWLNKLRSSIVENTGLSSADGTAFVELWAKRQVALPAAYVLMNEEYPDLFLDFLKQEGVGVGLSQLTEQVGSYLQNAKVDDEFLGRDYSDRLLAKIASAEVELPANVFVTLFGSFIILPLIEDLEQLGISDRVPTDLFKKESILVTSQKFNMLQESLRRRVAPFQL